ncbi:MAG TPA: hypothetical protein PKH01_08670, partial [Pseudomonadales bacterium]|nr:hypothetical protein [Pseudomonadales bacterium]
REEVSLLHYIAWLIDQHNYVPYQDVFETAFPGSLFFHTLIGRLWDYGDTAFHVFDWLWLAGLLFITGRILSLASARVAWVGVAALFAVYFAQSASMTLQRDYVGILPVALSLLFALQQNYALHWRSVTIGSLMAMAAWMKPHFLIALPVLAWVLLYPAGAPKIFSWRNRMLAVCGVIAGAVLVSAWVCVWLYVTGGLLPFLHMVSNYLPVYMGDDGIRTAVWVFLRESFLAAWVDRNIPVDLGGQNSAVDGWVWQVANIAGHLLEQFFAWLLLVGAGVWRGFALTQPKTQQRQLVIALLLLCVLFWWYPVLANKYWNYHWMPYRYFALLCGSLLLLPASNSKRWSRVVTVAA